jgi:hypothetical protein
VETFHWIILQIICRTRDILYLIYSEGACQYSNSSLRTRLNIYTPLHCKLDTNYHLFCKYNLVHSMLYFVGHYISPANWKDVKFVSEMDGVLTQCINSLKIAMIIYRCINYSAGMMLTNEIEHAMQQVIFTEQVIICIWFTVKGRVNIQTSPQGRVWILTRPFTVNQIQNVTCSANDL